MTITIIRKPVTIPRLVSVTRATATVTGGILGDTQYTIRGLVTNGTDNPKTAKNTTAGITKCISMLPARLGGVGNLCPFADGCADTCLNLTGRGSLPATQYARAARTIAFQLARDWAIDTIRRQLTNAQRRADKLGEQLFFRGNMLTDFPWESTGLVDEFDRCSWYDYSKNPRRFGAIRPNYWVTFSRGSDNEENVKNVLHAGGNVAVVFHNPDGKCGRFAHNQTLPAQFRIGGKTYPVLDGGLTDLRQLDPRSELQGGKCYTPYIVGLRLLAHTREKRAEAIRSGFSIQYPNWDDTRVAPCE